MIKYLPFIALFVSGGAALVLEVVWARMAILILGSTTIATTSVFAAFMAGLALGGFIIARFIRSFRRPFLAYTVAEFLTALVVLLLFLIWKKDGENLQIPFFLLLLILMLPTTFMGITIPLTVSGFASLGFSSSRASAWAYGINTVGGALGALTGAFWLLPKFGLQGANILGLFAIVVAGLLCLPLAAVRKQKESTGGTEDKVADYESKSPWFLLVAFWGGAASLSLEIVWTRLFSLILGPSVYALGVVLFVYLLGIALGAFLCPMVLRFFSGRRSMILCVLLLGFSVGWSVLTIDLLPYLFVASVEWFRPAPSSLRMIEFALSAFVMMPSALLHGLLLPLVMTAYPKQSILGKPVAISLAWNTLGAILGVTVTGLFLIPRFGLFPIIVGVLLINMILGLVLLFLWEKDLPIRLKQAASFLTLFFVLVFFLNSAQMWDRSVLASGVYKYAVGDALSAGKGQIEIGEIIYYREGISSTVAVIRTKNDRVLSIDGKADASAYGDRSTQVLLGALPASLSRNIDEVLVIGFASGVTAGVSSLFPNTGVTAVEIEPAVYEASSFS